MAAPVSWNDLVEAVMAAPPASWNALVEAVMADPSVSWMDLVEAAVSTGNLCRLKGNTVHTHHHCLQLIGPLSRLR